MKQTEQHCLSFSLRLFVHRREREAEKKEDLGNLVWSRILNVKTEERFLGEKRNEKKKIKIDYLDMSRQINKFFFLFFCLFSICYFRDESYVTENCCPVTNIRLLSDGFG